MGIIAPGALRQPSHQIKPRRTIQTQWIAIEQVRDESVVAISGVLIGHQLRVLPDPDNVGEEEDSSVLVDGLAGGFGYVGFDAANFDGFAGWLAPV